MQRGLSRYCASHFKAFPTGVLANVDVFQWLWQVLLYLKYNLIYFLWQASQNVETSSGMYQNVYFYDMQELSLNSSPLC